MHQHQRPRRHGHRSAAAVGQLRQLDRRRVRGWRARQVKSPQVAQQVTGVDGVGGAIGAVEDVALHVGQAGWVGQRASAGGNSLQQPAVARVDQEEVALAVGIVVARAKHQHPAKLARLHGSGLAVGEAEIGVAELPQHLGCHVGFRGHGGRVSDVDGEVALATLSQAADQQGAPRGRARAGGPARVVVGGGAVKVDVERGGRPIGKSLVGEIGVTAGGQAVHRRGRVGAEVQRRRHIRKNLSACGAAGGGTIDAVQDAGIGAHVQHRRAVGVGGLEAAVAGVCRIGKRCLRRAHRLDLGADDVAHLLRPVAVDARTARGRGVLFVRGVAAQVVQVVGAVVARAVHGVERRALGAEQVADAEGHGPGVGRVGVPGHHAAVGVPTAAGELRRQLAAESPGLCQVRRAGSGVKGHRIGQHFASPVAGVVLRAVTGAAQQCRLRQRRGERGGEGTERGRNAGKSRGQAGHHLVGPGRGEVVVRARLRADQIDVGPPPGGGQGSRPRVGVKARRDGEAAVLGGQVILVVAHIGAKFQHIEPVGGDGLHAQRLRPAGVIGADVAGVGVVGQPGDEVAAVADAGGSQRPANAFERTHLVGGCHRIDGAVGRDLGRLRGFVRPRGGTWQIAVPVGVGVTDAEDEVLLAGVLDRVVPVGDDGEAVHETGLVGVERDVAPGRHVTLVLEVAQCAVIELADRVAPLVGLLRLAELVEVVDDAAVSHRDAQSRRGGGGVRGIGVVELDPSGGVPFSGRVGHWRRAGHHAVRPDELLPRPQHTAVAVVVGGIVEVAEGAEADLLRILLQQPFWLVAARGVGLAVGFVAVARAAVAHLHARIEHVQAGTGWRAALAVMRGRAGGAGDERGRLREPDLVATCAHADPQGRIGQRRVVGDVAAGGGRPRLQGVGIRGRDQRKVAVAAIQGVAGGPGTLKNRRRRGVNAAVAPGQGPAERVDRLHRHPV